MRVDSANFIAKNKNLSKEARYVVQIAFDTAATDLVYFRSHDDAALPDGATYSDARCFAMPSKSQSINPIQATSSIGNISVRIQDTNDLFTALVYSKLAGGDGLRHKRIRVYLGYRGLAWSDYTLFHTQRINDWKYNNGEYIITCKDIQRSERKDIFIPKQTLLDAELDTTAAEFDSGTGTGVVTVKDTTYLQTVYHGSAWDDGTSAEYGYIKIDDEVIRYTGKTATTLTGCVGGRLGTRRTLHTTDTTSDETKKKVLEFIFLDLPVVKMIYAILTSTIHNTAYSLPDHWSLGIDTAYVDTSSFESIGADIWDTSDDGVGITARFVDLQKTTAKEFIEKKLFIMIGCTPIIFNDGQIGILRLANVTKDAPYTRLLNASNIVKYSDLLHDAQQVYNTYVINWNFVLEKKELTRQEIITDDDSITKHQASDALILDLPGLYGGRHTSRDLYNMFNYLRARYTGPPKLLTVDTFFSQNDLSVGDVVRVQLDQINDSAEGTTSLDQSFEIQQKILNPSAGTVTFKLFGSSEKPTPISATSASTALDSGMYSTTSLASGNKLDSNPGGITTTLTGGVLHIDGSGTFTGAATLPGTSNAAVYWYDGDVQLDEGVTITTTENVVIMIKGFFQCNGNISGVGGSTGTSGYFGTTQSQGGAATYAYFSRDRVGYITATIYAESTEGTNQAGTVNLVSDFNIDYQGGTSFSDLMSAGFPTDLRGEPGADGGALSGIVTTAGGSGGAGGSGVAIICQGCDAGANSSIDLSGDPGSAGTQSTLYSNDNIYMMSGAGGGGAPGVLAIFLDGSGYTETDFLTAFTANLGDCPKIGSPVPNPAKTQLGGGLYRSYYNGYDGGSANYAAFHVQHLTAATTPAVDSPLTTSKPSGITVTESTNTPETPSGNLTSINVSVTSPADTNYSHTNVYWKTSTQPDTAYQFAGTTNAEAVLVTSMDGTTYNIKTVPVSIYGVESQDFDVNNITVTNGTGGATLASGNYLKSGQTAYDTGTGFYLGNDSSTPKFSIGNSAGNKVTWDGSTLAVTGTITATTGAIGGWSIGSTTLTSTNIGLDSSNQIIYVGGSTFGSAGAQLLYSGGSGQLYAGNGLNNFAKYDGTNFTVGQDVLLQGTASINNNNIFLAGYPKQLPYKITAGGGSSSNTDYYTYYQSSVSSATDYVYYQIIDSNYLALTSLTWSVDKRFRQVIKVYNDLAYQDIFIIMGNASSYYVGFKLDHTDSHTYAVSSDSGGTYTNDLGASDLNKHLYDIVYDASGPSAELYIDGSLVDTITTHIPTGTTVADYLCGIWVIGYTGASNSRAYIGWSHFIHQ